MGFGTNNLTSRTTNFDPVSAMLGSSTTWGPEEQAAAARNQGWTVTGNQAQQFRNGVRYTRDLSNFLAPASQNQFANIPDVLKQAAIYDTSQMQGAADETYNKMNAKFGAIDNLINQGSASLENLGKQLGGDALSAAEQAEALAADQRDELTERADAMVGRVRGDVDKSLSQMPKYYKGLDKANSDIDEAYRLGDQSVADYKASMKGYKDLSAQTMSAAASGIRRSFHTAMQQVRTGTTPDGRQLSATEQMAAMEQIRFQAGQQVQEQITPLQSHFNDTMMQLSTQLAGLQQNNAGLRIQGAGLRGNLEGQRLQGINTELGGAQIKAGAEQTSLDMVARANEGVRQMYQLGATLREAGSTVATTVQMKALELELNGQVALSQVMLQNPRSIVSYFQSFLALMSVNATQGGGGDFGGGGGTENPMTPKSAANPAGGQQRPQNPGGAPFGQQGGVGYGYGYTKPQRPQNPGGAPFGQQGGVGAGQGYNKPQRPQRPQNPAGGIMGPPEYQMTGTEEDFFA